MFYFTNYVVLIAIFNIMKGVINDGKIDMVSEFYNLDAQILLVHYALSNKPKMIIVPGHT